jgi:hypothetical protein
MEDKSEALGPRCLVIVSRDQPELISYMFQDFADLNGAEVVLDRRWQERRQRAWIGELDRRSVDRRQGFSGERSLCRRGFAIFHRQDAGLTMGRMA